MYAIKKHSSLVYGLEQFNPAEISNTHQPQIKPINQWRQFLNIHNLQLLNFEEVKE